MQVQELLTVALFTALVSGVISILTNWIPHFNTWYTNLSQDNKRYVMLATMAVVSLGIWLVSCYEWFVLVTCTEKGLKDLIAIFISALVTNQATYLAVPAPKKIQDLKYLNKLKKYEIAPADAELPQ